MRTTSDICLVHLFNHRYEGNLPVLDKLYGDRFRNRLALMPFYRGDRPDVVRIYEGSENFEGFLAQAYGALSKRLFTHYVVCADDLILHPRLNEENIAEELRLTPEAGYIKSYAGLDADPPAWPYVPAFHWIFAMPALVNLAEYCGVDWKRELPPVEEATSRFESYGIEPGSIRLGHLRGANQLRSVFLFFFYVYKRLQLRCRTPPSEQQPPLLGFPYPLAKGYSDLFVIPGAVLERFCHLCGVLAAMSVFAEIAIPTAMILCCARIVQEADTNWRGVAYWHPGEANDFAERFGHDYARLAAGFEEDLLYVHPIKLSQWSV